MYPKRNIEVHVPLQAGKSNHVDIASLNRLSDEVQEPGILKLATSESPERFQMVRADSTLPKGQDSTVDGVEPRQTPSAQEPEPALDRQTLNALSAEEFLQVAELHSVDELAKALGIAASTVRGRICRYVAAVAKAKGLSEAEMKSEFDSRRLESGALTREGFRKARAKSGKKRKTVEKSSSP